MIAEILKAFSFIVFMFQLSNCKNPIRTFDELRLNLAQKPSDEMNAKIEKIFSNLTKSETSEGLVTNLKYKSYDDSNTISLFNGGSRASYIMDRKANVALKAYEELLYTDKDAALNYHKRCIKIPAPFCPNEDKYSCNPSYHYRSVDGSCNNLEYPWWGRRETPYKRALPADYEDGVSFPRVRSVTGGYLPNSRKLAMTIHAPRDTESEWTHLFIFFGQHITHDMSLLSIATYANGDSKRCPCDSADRDCFNIKIPYEDYLNEDQKCMEFVRSSASFIDFDCNLGPREQLNRVTHWLDMGNVYGDNVHIASKLRTYKDGLLKSSFSEFTYLEELPKLPGCPSRERTRKCYLAGEVRNEENLMLTALQTLWIREHNRVARILYKINPKWDDETIYQEAKRIVNAEYQHIIYNEFLPVALGYDELRKYDLEPLEYGYLYKYNPGLYPQALNEFVTAAFRSYHTLVADTQFLGDKYHNLYSEEDIGDLQFNSSLTYFNPIDHILYGILNHPSYIPSPRVNPPMNHHLFEGVHSNKYTKRWSLPAINIQRGRDHGFPSYNFYRELCGLNRAYSFDELTYIPKYLIEKLSYLYAHPDDIDLFTGIVSEAPIPKGTVGPTATCLIAKQFYDLKFGDRFYYENGHDKKSRFTSQQLNSIRQVSMSRIMCDNTEIYDIQRNSFLMPEFSPRVSCNEIPSLDLNHWRDYY